MQMGITQSLWLSRCIMHHLSQFSSGSKPVTRESCMLAMLLCMSQCASAMYTWPAELFHSTPGCALTVQSGQLAVPCFSSKPFLLLERNTDGCAGLRESIPPSSLLVVHAYDCVDDAFRWMGHTTFLQQKHFPPRRAWQTGLQGWMGAFLSLWGLLLL